MNTAVAVLSVLCAFSAVSNILVLIGVGRLRQDYHFALDILAEAHNIVSTRVHELESAVSKGIDLIAGRELSKSSQGGNGR